MENVESNVKSNPFTFKRIALCALGIFFVSFGVAITAFSELGTSPISSLAWVAHKVAEAAPFIPELSFGTTTLALNVLFFLAQWAILRRDFGKLQFLQLPCTFAFGASIDFCMGICGLIPTSIATFYPARVAMVFIGCAVVALGLACEFAAEVLYLPGDGIVKTIANAVKMKFGVTKISFDVFLTVSSVVMSLALIRQCVGVREGTLISMFAVGYFVKLYQPLIDRLSRLVR